MSKPNVREAKIQEFKPQQENANDHTPRGMAMLEGEMNGARHF